MLAAAIAAAILATAGPPVAPPPPAVVVAAASGNLTTGFTIRDLAGAQLDADYSWLFEPSEQPGCDNGGLGRESSPGRAFYWFHADCRAQGRNAGVVTAVYRTETWECRAGYEGFAAGTGPPWTCALHANSAPLQILENVRLTRERLAELARRVETGNLPPSLLRREDFSMFFQALLELPGRSSQATGTLLNHFARTSKDLEAVARARTQDERERAALPLYWGQQVFGRYGESRAVPVAARAAWARISVDIKVLRSRLARGAILGEAATKAARDLRLRIRKLTARLPAVWGKPFATWYADVEQYHVAWGVATDSTDQAETVASLRTMSRAADKVAIRVRIIWGIPAQ